MASKFPAAATKMTGVSREAAAERRIKRIREPPGPAVPGRRGTTAASWPAPV